MKKVNLFIYTAVYITLFISCNSKVPELYFKTGNEGKTFNFYDASTGQIINYEKLKYQGRDVYKVYIPSRILFIREKAPQYFYDDICLAFSENEYKEETTSEGIKITWDGGIRLAKDFKGKYSLIDGILDIKGNGQKIDGSGYYTKKN